jgi:putative zinc finger/helix-turn-helix YgiT family protein
MEKLFCEKCDDFVEYDITKKEEIFNIMDKEEIVIKSKIAICEECKNELFHEKLEKENQRKAFDIYRENNNLLYPEEIAEIREKYELTQKEMSKLLGWGEITYHRYENGCLPDKAYNTQLMLIKNPNNVRSILARGNHGLSDEKAEELKRRIKQLTTKDISDNKELLLSIPEEFYEDLTLRAEKADMELEEYVRYLLMRKHYKDVIQHTKEKTEYKTIMQMLKEISRSTELEKWSQQKQTINSQYKRHQDISPLMSITNPHLNQQNWEV